MIKNRFFILIFVLLPAILIFTGVKIFYLKPESRYEGYDSIGGKKVTKDTILRFVEPTPVELKEKVRGWFQAHPKAYEVLVKQNGFLKDVGNLILNAKLLFKLYGISNLGNFNYVFRIPGERFFIKIFGANNRFAYSVSYYKFSGSGLYLRRMEKKFDDTYYPFYEYMDFDQDKERIKSYFYLCCPKAILMRLPSKKQIKELIHIVTGAFPQSALRGFIYDCLIKKYGHNGFAFQSIKDAFNQMLDFSSYAASYRCYNKKDLLSTAFIDTYNIANRVFYRVRFVEAIDKFQLDRLERPPKSYVINVSSKRRRSCMDKDVVLVQYPLQNHRPFKFYLKRPMLLNKIFDKKSFGQLLRAMKYAGLWDITGENIYVNTKTKRITYIDFEPKNDILPHEIFNKSEEKRKLNLCYLMFEFLKRFPVGTAQRESVLEFIQDNKEIDLSWYAKVCREKGVKSFDSGFEFVDILIQSYGGSVKQSALGELLYYAEPMSDARADLRKEVVDRLLG